MGANRSDRCCICNSVDERFMSEGNQQEPQKRNLARLDACATQITPDVVGAMIRRWVTSSGWRC
jgi:hypothetical protein